MVYILICRQIKLSKNLIDFINYKLYKKTEFLFWSFLKAWRFAVNSTENGLIDFAQNTSIYHGYKQTKKSNRSTFVAIKM